MRVSPEHAAQVLQDTVEGSPTCWFTMTHPKLHVSLIVAMSMKAWKYCFARFGAYDIVLTWDELVGCTAGIAELKTGEERDMRFREAMEYFAKRQNMNHEMVFGHLSKRSRA